jgi:hypothetical protein
MMFMSAKKLKLMQERSYWEGVVEGQRRVREMLAENGILAKHLVDSLHSDEVSNGT